MSPHTHVSVCTHPCLARCLDSGCSVRPPCLLSHTCQSVLTHAWPGVWTADVVYARHVPSHTHTCQSVLTHAWPGVWTADVVYARHVPSHTHVSVCTHPCLARCLDSGRSVRPPCLLSHTRVSLYSPMPGPVSGQRM